jgi:hypothetical protein
MCRVRLLNEHGNFDVEGVDNINACYGGTAALLNTMAWVRFPQKAREFFLIWKNMYVCTFTDEISLH